MKMAKWQAAIKRSVSAATWHLLAAGENDVGSRRRNEIGALAKINENNQ
jgi:hypothetical protein